MSELTIKLLNDVLLSEFTTINQYWLYGLILSHQSLKKLGDIFLKESTEERNHMEKIAKRILQLGGEPTFNTTKNLKFTTKISEMLDVVLDLEEKTIKLYQEIIAKVEEIKDFATADILSQILTEEENHKEWLNSQLQLLEKIGEQLYFSKIMNIE